jgi:hypothetical protein
MNSLVQVLFSLPEFSSVFLTQADVLINAGYPSPADSFGAQMFAWFPWHCTCLS